MKRGFFTFDNLFGEYSLLGKDIADGVPTAVSGLSDAEKYLIASLVEGRCVYLAADALSAQHACEAIATLSGKRCALLSAKDEVLTYRKAFSRDALYRRLNALYAWQTGAEVLVLDVESALQLIPMRMPVIRLSVGTETEFSALVDRLIEMGYSREYQVEAQGAFAVHGDILDIFPVNCDHPVRIDFFGDEVEAIKPYDEATGERLAPLSAVEILTATDVVYAEGEAEHVAKALRDECKKAPNAAAYTRMQTLAEELGERGERNGFVLPLLRNSCYLFDVLQRDALVIFDECKLIRDRLSALWKEHEERFSQLYEGGEVMRFSRGQYEDEEKFMQSFSSRRNLALMTFAAQTHFFNPLRMRNIPSVPVRRYLNGFSDLIVDLTNWARSGYRVILCSGGGERAKKLRDLLEENALAVGDLPDSLLALRGRAIVEDTLEKGFILHDCKLAVIGSGDLFLKAPARRKLKKRRGDLFVAPEIGDYAVHETYGIGRITGMKKIETTDGVKEYVALAYRDGDTLYVPVEQMDILSKYMGGDEPALSKIGGGEFERVKARVRASLKKMAFDLKALYAERQEKTGYVFPYYAEEMEEFEAAFPYEDTPDQRTSFEEIRADMCSSKVMDRLLCGDVGFGKTEVALRAAYLCILAGRQAALMCPSTVLSEQHFQTATERMASFGVSVACLNRFRTEREQRAILADLKAGKIDLVVGTHRLLSSDVVFHDLGLLILDEEQRFGVEHKEKLKTYKRNVDCLTMTATPIPRTLHLSLSGIRDISTIQTPPQARLPVQTYVTEETEPLIRDACIREIARGGQVFVLYNRVESINSFAAHIREIVPEARIAVAHGRMDHATLERNVFGFYRREEDILVTTTIIENGIDLPNANTLIVIDADRLGISQLYQLRGRVGRGTRLAHAYFTYKPERLMTENAAERLKAIMQFTELGSGFRIAMRDLEIRGAGNVLGAEQHGHMDKIGYELYSKFLKEELTGEVHESVDLDIKTTAFIPESYVESNAGRMDCYKQIAEIRSAADYKRVTLSLEETYGKMPEETHNLLLIAICKEYASRFHVKKITLDHRAGTLQFSALEALSDKKLAAAMEQYKGKYALDMTSAPALRFPVRTSGSKTLLLMTKFLKFAATFP